MNYAHVSIQIYTCSMYDCVCVFVGVRAYVYVIFHVRNCVFIGTLYCVLDVQKYILSLFQRELFACHVTFIWSGVL